MVIVYKDNLWDNVFYGVVLINKNVTNDGHPLSIELNKVIMASKMNLQDTRIWGVSKIY